MTMADEKPELTSTQRSLRTFGIFLLVFAGPLLVGRGVCVSYREVCERVGGHYGEIAGVTRVCSVPEGHACPRPYRWSESGVGCTTTGTLPVIWRWSMW
jgi:hypothetical protein